jgi:hypothetical protein
MAVVMMEAASTSERSVNIYQITRRNIPEDIFINGIALETILPCFSSVLWAVVNTVMNLRIS